MHRQQHCCAPSSCFLCFGADAEAEEAAELPWTITCVVQSSTIEHFVDVVSRWGQHIAFASLHFCDLQMLRQRKQQS